jgi:hypothetical protein
VTNPLWDPASCHRALRLRPLVSLGPLPASGGHSPLVTPPHPKPVQSSPYHCTALRYVYASRPRPLAPVQLTHWQVLRPSALRRPRSVRAPPPAIGSASQVGSPVNSCLEQRALSRIQVNSPLLTPAHPRSPAAVSFCIPATPRRFCLPSIHNGIMLLHFKSKGFQYNEISIFARVLCQFSSISNFFYH